MKILVLRFSSIGDIVLTTPVLRILKTQLDDVKLHFATKEKFANILASNPYLDQIHRLGTSEAELIQELKIEKFDLIIDLHNNLRTWLIQKKLGVKTYRFDKLNIKKWLFTNFKIDLLPNIHIVDRYLASIAPLGVKGDALGLDFFIPEHDEVQNNWLPETHQNGYIALVIGATYHTKRLPLKRLIELCDRINQPIILLGGPEDSGLGEQIQDFFMEKSTQNLSEDDIEFKLGKKALIFNACGKFNLNQSASLIKKARYVFTHDTGLMHIAAAFKKHIYSIWGNTTPKFGMYPYRTSFVVFENNQLQCRPCSKIGFEKCPKNHFKCMNDLVFDFYLPNN
ncbi:MAG: glycosyltransferase family 9 protein [Flammeovirgaceae bacterium]|jgi:ADP-heptose:LPS heptosyltransferase|nr:glycosyltransferase family 9 protein [Flammeovirgaceae bacterium]|tara:strand:+ start:64126 stop:65142 length:1017 start_codon:yes stop_codon:yes gene_type:complete